MAKTVPLRRNTAFQLLWVGGAADGLGTEVTKLATPLLVLAATGSPAWAGVVARASLAGSMAVAVPAGVWIDRWDRRRVLVAGQAVLGGALAAGLGAAPRWSWWGRSWC